MKHALPSRSATLAALAITAAVVVAPACSSSTDDEPLPVIMCSSSEIATAMDVATDVHVFVDAELPPLVQADLGAYLSRLWKRPIAVTPGTPDGSSGDAIWISSSPAAKTRTNAPDGGYALVRADEGGRKVLVAAAGTPADLTSAAYALLEELGVRFFHPMQELVPTLDGPRFPRALEARRTPMTKVRGLQIHLLHPLEYLRTLDEPGEANLAEARRLVDWLVKTGQNHLQWPLLGSLDWAPFAEHARQIVAYAHARGVTVGTSLNLSSKGSLQNNYVLVRDEAKFAENIAAGLSRALEVPWDDIELALGEFLAAEPENVVTWLNAAVEHVAKVSPSTHVNVQNHVGNYPQLYVQYKGMPTYFYHLPRYADARLGQTTHTLFWFDTYRDQGMYEHPDFHFQREFMFSQLPARRVRYFPESAYWIAADVDVPIFLPEFVESRWTDIHGLDRDITAAGLPKLEGHVTFSSGHEWGYWLTDYLAAKMLWEPGAPLERFVTHYTSAYGSCAAGVGAELTQLIALQRHYLFDEKLVPYVSGEDATVETAASLGIVIRPIRKKFEALVTGTEAERVAFETSVIGELDAMSLQIKPIEDSLAARCRGSDAVLTPWCNELRDGARIVRVRLEHVVSLYRAILAHARGDSDAARSGLARARAKTEEAKSVIEEREKGYRFDVGRLTDAYSNPTVYSFGYLRQAHTQCLWRRRDEFARLIIEENVLNDATDVPTCLN
jgi:hypothetical protein